MRYICTLLFSLILGNSLYANTTITALIPHYLYQFAYHIKKKSVTPVYHIHIIGKNTLLKKNFKKVLVSKKVRGKKFLITQGSTLKVPKSTNMIYLSTTSELKFQKLSHYVEGKSILLVSFEQNDKKRVMINLFLSQNKKLNFEINRANILNEGFKISDKIVLMGGTELDVAKLFKGAKNSLQKKELALKESRRKLQETYKKTETLKKRNSMKIAQLKAIKKEVKILLKDIKRAKKDLLKEKELFRFQKLKNRDLQKNLLINNKMHTKMKIQLTQMSLKIEEKNRYIFKRKNTLLDVNKKITLREKELKELNKVTVNQGKQIESQKDTISFMLIALVLFITLIVVIIIMYRKQHQVSQRLKNTLAKLRDTQEELLQSAKMASIGELVSGLAHEMNTPIGISITGVSVLQHYNHELKNKMQDKRLKESDLISFFKQSNGLYDSLNISLQKAAQLVQSFKQVSVDQQVEALREFNFSEYVDTILISLKKQFKHSNIILNVEIDNKIVLYSYPGVYYQILTNLINNSLLHGFDGENEGSISIEAKIQGDILHMTYKDTGKGVSKKNLPHIFEPFFTTKRANGGTGLGLHIIYNLITQKLHGSIKAHGKEGDGLIFIMNFPLTIKGI